MEIEKFDDYFTPASAADVCVGIDAMSESVKELAEAGDWESLARGLAPLQDVLRQMRFLETQVKTSLAEILPERLVTIENVGTVERFRKTTRKNWDSEELLRSIVHIALVDEETGEIPSSPIEAVERVLNEIRACVPFTGSTAWRVGALKERGFDPDEWCDQNVDGYSLKFTRNEGTKND